MLQVTVSLPSASGEILQLPEHSKVGDLKILAQKTFGKGLLKLVTEGRLLTNSQDSLLREWKTQRTSLWCNKYN